MVIAHLNIGRYLDQDLLCTWFGKLHRDHLDGNGGKFKRGTRSTIKNFLIYIGAATTYGHSEWLIQKSF